MLVAIAIVYFHFFVYLTHYSYHFFILSIFISYHDILSITTLFSEAMPCLTHLIHFIFIVFMIRFARIS